MSFNIRILIVDDHMLFRESIARFLQQERGMVVSGICGDLAEARKLLKQMPVDIVLLDYDLGGELGTDLIATIKSRYPGCAILLVTGGVSPSITRRALQAGVAGTVLKHSSPQQLIEAVRRVANGGTWWDQASLAAVASPQPEASLFSERQVRIMSLLLDGLTNKELAARLDVSEPAVKASLQELFRKTGVRTRSQLVRIALETSPELPRVDKER